MAPDPKEPIQVTLPDDLQEKVSEFSARYGESARFIVIAAVEHFTRIPEEQRKAILKGTALRRRGY